MTPEERAQGTQWVREIMEKIENFGGFQARRATAAIDEEWSSYAFWNNQIDKAYMDIRLEICALYVAAHRNSPEADAGT